MHVYLYRYWDIEQFYFSMTWRPACIRCEAEPHIILLSRSLIVHQILNPALTNVHYILRPGSHSSTDSDPLSFHATNANHIRGTPRSEHYLAHSIYTTDAGGQRTSGHSQTLVTQCFILQAFIYQCF